MKAKPDGPKYRNLVARGEAIYYERVYQGRRFFFSTKTSKWDEAAAVRDEYEARRGIGLGVLRLEAPRLEDFAKRYLEKDTEHLAPTTRRERERALAAEGPIVGALGSLRLDEITTPRLREWWSEEVAGKRRSTKTGRNFLDAITGVLMYAIELELLDTNPVDDFRAVLRRKARTQKGRAERAPGRDVRPIEHAHELKKLVEAARGEGLEAYVLVLLLLDAGLRMGEALGLRWGAITWGDGEDDRRRALLIDLNRPRGGAAGPPKGGAPPTRPTLSAAPRCAARPLPASRATLCRGLCDPARPPRVPRP